MAMSDDRLLSLGLSAEELRELSARFLLGVLVGELVVTCGLSPESVRDGFEAAVSAAIAARDAVMNPGPVQ